MPTELGAAEEEAEGEHLGEVAAMSADNEMTTTSNHKVSQSKRANFLLLNCLLSPCDPRPHLQIFKRAGKAKEKYTYLMILVSTAKFHISYFIIGTIVPPFTRPPFGKGKYGLIGGVASCEGYIEYIYTEFVL